MNATVARSGRLRGARLATVALVSVFLAIAAPLPAFAADGVAKLALTPVGQAGPYFDLSMRPGETRSLKVDIANVSGAALAARTYASDVYTIVNGGFGGRLRDEPQTGTTRWLDYPTDVFDLPTGKIIHRQFTVAVPTGTGPGEYITSLVLENDQPIPGDGAVALKQIVRQAVAVVVTVPGLRSPALLIGAATYKLVAERGVVSVAVENTGNVRLKPIVAFTLFDAAGAQVSQATMRMDTFYAHTATFIEVPLPTLLTPGAYTVRLSLGDADQGARADEAAIALVVVAPPQTAPDGGAGSDIAEVIQAIGEGRTSLPVSAVGILGSIALTLVIGAFAYIRRRRRGARTSGL